MHLLNELDLLVKRQTLAEKSGINYVYLCSMVNKKSISADVEEKLKKAVKKIIKDLEKHL